MATAFNQIDTSMKGFIMAEEVRDVYKLLGHKSITDEEFQALLAKTDIDPEQEISFDDFLKLADSAGKPVNSQAESDYDTLLAFVSMGGTSDMSGEVDVEKLRKVVKEFDLTIDIEGLVHELDNDGDGKVKWEEFKAMLTAPSSPLAVRKGVQG
eukprot:CAMPEP_0181291174 /NCGR_PEP_ID=MMETSP1101-20121128/1823_1 /TAXON_ID=46948 /ORGANISM="Rhodomonas abbreviata, Strain Caron Lab Isolate" /LENGTH=153 /DNA_ID=CAMNT_0023395541 /DNA_START=124 /DNA_END=585 /DNA_ORIENTATION=+